MAKISNNLYYDIESIRPVFSLVTYMEKTNELEVYYLRDENNKQNLTNQETDIITKKIFKENRNFNGSIKYFNMYDLDANLRIAETFGLKAIDIPKAFQRDIVSDIDEKFDENIHFYIMGYNSINYDLTMLAEYFERIFYDDGHGNFYHPMNPAEMREFNDELFSPAFKRCMPDRLRCRLVTDREEIANRAFQFRHVGDKYYDDEKWDTGNPSYYIREAWLKSGRHIDVARLNEKQARVALKRQLGNLGYQILESDIDLSGKNEKKSLTIEELASLIAYNVSDVVNLKNLYHDKNYEASFMLKKQLLLDYPELIFDKDKKEYKPDKSRTKKNRLTINSTSAQLAAACLCPYDKLKDDDKVSFDYPSEEKAKELGIPRVNVLDETAKFIDQRLKPLVHDEEGEEIIQGLNQMIEVYKSIEGKNFNNAIDEDAANIKFYSKKVNVPYMGPDGKATSCYVTFSVGGIHGAEYNKEKYQSDLAAWKHKQEIFQKIKNTYGDATSFLNTTNDKGKACRRKTVEIDGVTYETKDFLKSGSTLAHAEYKADLEDPSKKPMLFKPNKKGIYTLPKNYAVTSFGMSNHEDFTSYYPSMLINMSAFKNEGLGYDRYFEIFGNKEKFGKLMKDKTLSEEERDTYSIMRNGTKLILNSASGAADMEYSTPIKMNNRIIAMRIIGQLFTWRIGQAQSLEGALVTSTNTDGLYTVMDEEENAKILAREAEAIHVGIEPEPIFLVSKDANNRWEGEKAKTITGNALTDVKILSASGGTLACMKGPNTGKSLDHPAVIDWALAEFLKYKALKGNMDEFEPDVGKYLLETVMPYTFTDKVKQLLMFQNIISSNPNKGAYNFACPVPVTDENQMDVYDTVIGIQHYNRVFYVDPSKVPDDHKKDIVYLCVAKVRPEKSDPSPLALKVVGQLNGDTEILNTGTAKLQKISGIERNTPCIICNEDLNFTTNIDVSWLDFEYYKKLLAETYAKNWENKPVGVEIEDDDEDEAES